MSIHPSRCHNMIGSRGMGLPPLDWGASWIYDEIASSLKREVKCLVGRHPREVESPLLHLIGRQYLRPKVLQALNHLLESGANAKQIFAFSFGCLTRGRSLQVVSELLVRLSRFHCLLLAMLSALYVLLGFAFV